jgi:hypothetical protein
VKLAPDLPRVAAPADITGEQAPAFDLLVVNSGIRTYLRPQIRGEWDEGEVAQEVSGAQVRSVRWSARKVLRKRIRKKLASIRADGREPMVLVFAIADGVRVRVLVGVEPERRVIQA